MAPAGELSYEDPVSLRARIDHAFEYRDRRPGTAAGHGIASGQIRKSRSYRLPEFVFCGPAEPAGPGQEQVHGHADKRVLSDPLALSPALTVERPADPGQLVELVGPQPQFLALKALPFGSL